MTPQKTQNIVIEQWQDVIKARQSGRDIASDLNFSKGQQVRIATVISELSRNILQHSGAPGEVIVESLCQDGREGICIRVNDNGIGIRNEEQALLMDNSTQANLGAGLPGSKKLMDFFELQTEPGKGVKVRMILWRQ